MVIRARPSPSRARRPFEVALSADQRIDLIDELAHELDSALAARLTTDKEIEYWHTLYEQGRTRGQVNTPWADAADLTSYLGTQYVDVLRSEIVRTVMTEPVWTVEGYGAAAARAPFVEEFHQWQLELERFQQVFTRAVHLSLIEPRGVLEFYEETVKRPIRRVILAKLQQAPDGTILTDDQLVPMFARDAQGQYIEVADEETAAAEVEIDQFDSLAVGPRARAIPYRDYVQLPEHATQRSEIWGHAKRCWIRLDQLRERARQGIYDAKTVEALGSDDERATDTTLAGDAKTLAPKEGTDRVEKELWELTILKDLDRSGLRWYAVTLHKDKRELLRIQYDDIGQPRFFSLVPFPRPYSTEGYSYVGHKLITVIEEHTAWRNMLADRAALQLQAPMKVLTGALWNPDREPIGPKSVITVRDMNEVQPMLIPDVTAPAIERIRDAERAGERLAGINDAAAGVTSEERRTLGEIRIVTAQSLGRVSEAVRNIQETLEEIAQVRHLMWKRALAELGPEGMELPQSTLAGLEARGVNVLEALPNRRMTAMMLEGVFRFKPRGSVETADRDRQRFDFNEWIKAMTTMMALNPMIAAIFQTPQAARALLDQGIRLYHVHDKQAFLGSQALALLQQQTVSPQPPIPGNVGQPQLSQQPPIPGNVGRPRLSAADLLELLGQ